MKHWAFNYIGIKGVSGGRNLAGVDCWGLLYLVYRDEFHIALPELPGIDVAPMHHRKEAVVEGQESWIEITAPQEGCAVGMSQSRLIHHVGIWTNANGGRVIHCWPQQGVIADTIRSLRLKGMCVIRYYRHKLWCTS